MKQVSICNPLPPPSPPPPPQARPGEAGGIKVYHNRFYATLTAMDISFCYKLLHCFMADFVYVRQFGGRVNTFDNLVLSTELTM